MADLIPAIANLLRADATLMALLPSGQNGVILAETLAFGRVPPTLQLPCIAVKDGGSISNILPYSTQLVYLRVYDFAEPNALTYININNICNECVRVLHRVSLATMTMTYDTPLEIWYDNFISPDNFDTDLKLPYRYIRFKVYTVSVFHDNRGG